jgi:hypothetical protein
MCQFRVYSYSSIRRKRAFLTDVLDFRFLNPVKSEKFNNNIKLDKLLYLKGEIPEISISGYNKTSFPETVDYISIYR